jgi:G patch domain-containing protein 1
MGMYGPMTRSVADFFPTRLLCKRFNVKPPAHVQPEPDVDTKSSPQAGGPAAGFYGNFSNEAAPSSGSLALIQAGAGESPPRVQGTATDTGESGKVAEKRGEATVDSTRNEALEGKRAGEEVFKAIFGDSDDDDDDDD